MSRAPLQWTTLLSALLLMVAVQVSLVTTTRQAQAPNTVSVASPPAQLSAPRLQALCHHNEQPLATLPVSTFASTTTPVIAKLPRHPWPIQSRLNRLFSLVSCAYFKSALRHSS
ncbi:hypothetical protein LJ739_17235 [Aestuariibacter halophilus]|uniref:Secreted protein n=1 Tax=Fluctibacter halophilus TaxID=226011 RepID=A0ABS8GFN2_9ALTE|nr:hypothetical protein [Aestuariibacter halophilus]MCC2618001.1 hypothetical protein [Aestuariibacter halophilus]